jgi:hypothetical protein
MASDFLTVASSLSCPHGGTVTASTSNTRVKANGELIVRSTDTFTIAGCSYMIGTVPHPCVQVQWDVHCERHDSQGDPSLNRDSVGLCKAGDGATQGTVIISSTQARGAGS